MKDIIQIIRGFTPQQIAVIITIIGACFTGFFWVENRYANLKKTEENIEKISDNIIQIHSKISATISEFPEDRIKRIEESAKKQEIVIKQLMGRKEK
jgi:hypothetical protein